MVLFSQIKPYPLHWFVIPIFLYVVQTFFLCRHFFDSFSWLIYRLTKNMMTLLSWNLHNCSPHIFTVFIINQIFCWKNKGKRFKKQNSSQGRQRKVSKFNTYLILLKFSSYLFTNPQFWFYVLPAKQRKDTLIPEFLYILKFSFFLKTILIGHCYYVQWCSY